MHNSSRSTKINKSQLKLVVLKQSFSKNLRKKTHPYQSPKLLNILNILNFFYEKSYKILPRNCSKHNGSIVAEAIIVSNSKQRSPKCLKWEVGLTLKKTHYLAAEAVLKDDLDI